MFILKQITPKCF